MVEVFHQKLVILLAFFKQYFLTQWAFKAAMTMVAVSMTTRLETVKALTSTKGRVPELSVSFCCFIFTLIRLFGCLQL